MPLDGFALSGLVHRFRKRKLGVKLKFSDEFRVKQANNDQVPNQLVVKCPEGAMFG